MPEVTYKVTEPAQRAHVYIHVLLGEDSGILLRSGYGGECIRGGGGPTNRYEALGYLWEGYIRAYGTDALGSFGDDQPWCHFQPIGSGWDYCSNQEYR
jgi:hypothetical protein